MSYISNDTRISKVEIAGVDYTSRFIQMAVSDSSANRSGCVLTSGTIELGASIEDAPSSDYFRERFRRGDTVDVFVTIPGGGSVIHPRGALYVVSNSYDVESEVLSIEVACRLSLMSLTENKDPSRISELAAFVPIDLDPVQSTFGNCCAGISSAGQYIYQDSSRNLQVREFWAGDNNVATASGDWLSVLGVTTNSIAPLSGGEAIPDQINLSYQIPDDGSNSDNKGRIDLASTDSYYFLQYPATTYQRQNSDADANNPNGTLENVSTSSTSYSSSTGGSSSCGNTPPPPTGNDGEPVESSCNEGYVLVQTPVYLPARRREESITSYDGPGAQVSTVVTKVFGPRLEANSQYFADYFAYCRQTYSNACDFDGGCPYLGMDQIQLGYTTQTNYYGSANELVRTIQDTYQTLLSGAQPADWRAGNVSGEIQDFSFRFTEDSSLYRSSRVDSQYYQEGNVNVQKTDTYTSMTARGVGIKSTVDALSGIKSVQIRKSATITTLDVQPDIINSPTTSTVEKITQIPLFTGRFVTPPTAAGPYILDEAMPQPVLLETEEAIEALVANYTNYVTRFTKGEAFGLQIAEGLRDEVLNNYYPGMPFRYYDPNKDVLIAMRMDATTWGVNGQEAAFVTSGMWNGISDGTVTIPENILGNSSPDMNAESNGVEPGFGGSNSNPAVPTPPPAVVPPSVDNENSVDSGAFAWYVDVNLYFKADAFTFTIDGVQPPPPSSEDVASNWTTVMYVDGLVVETGGLLAAGPGGSIPLDYNGSLVTNNGVFVQTLFD